MKLNVNTFSEDKVESTEDIKKTIAFGFAAGHKKTIFTIFTKHLYSNPIGSIVREITSNCFDSHQEAGVNEPVILKLIKENNQHYLNFIDVGVGMSPDRINNVYSEYFNSTKHNDPNQIGGWGIGGKTPLAYAESFYLITNYNGIKYIWCVYKGEESPLLDLLSEEPTTDRNGTTIKLPIKLTDQSSFEYEMERQLYYFNNIIFEGFSNNLSNDYTIYQGKHFIYRGLNYSSRMHICLGHVAYPLDYFALGLLESDYNVPVALKFDIGEIEVTPSRENIQYTESTIKTIKKKLELAKEELKTMIQIQYKNIGSLTEYYETKNNFGHLVINKEKNLTIHLSGVVRHEDLVYPKFADIKIPTSEILSDLLITNKTMGRKKKRENYWNGDILSMNNWHNLYFINYKEKKHRRVQSWLKLQHELYFFITPNQTISEENINILEEHVLNNTTINAALLSELINIKTAFIPYDTKPSKKIFDQIRLLLREALEMVKSKVVEYKNINVPSEFVMLRNNEFGKEMLDKKMTIGHVRVNYKNRRESTTFNQLLNFKGTIIYGSRDDSNRVSEALELLSNIQMVKKNDKLDFFGSKNTIQGIVFNKTSEPIMHHLKNGIHFKDVYSKLIIKKREKIIKALTNQAFLKRYNNLNTLFFNKALTSIDKTLRVHTDILIKAFKKIPQYDQIYLYNLNLKNLKIDITTITGGFERQFKYLEEQIEKNHMIRYINIPYSEDARKNEELMKLINIVYTK